MHWPMPHKAKAGPQLHLDAVELRLYAQLLDAVCEEMGSVLQRSAYSPNIKERRDFSTALFDAAGNLAAQGHNIPVHLGSMYSSVQAVLAHCADKRQPLQPGDVLLLNNPYQGGTHLPDLTLVAAFNLPGTATPLFYLANRAHHADIGGATGGGLGLATELLQEGLVIPPVHLVRAGLIQDDVLSILLANNRTPQERLGDLSAQLAALRRGEQRLGELLDGQQPADKLQSVWAARLEDLYRYSGQAVQELIQHLPAQEVRQRECLEVPDAARGMGPMLRLRLRREAEVLTFDFSASDPQHPGPFNAVRAITLSAVFYCLRCLLPAELPTNQGLLRSIQVITRPGTVVDAIPPAAVAAANVETSQRLVDLVLGALRKLLPQRIPAASQGSMNNVVFSGLDCRLDRSGQPFTYYETIGGGHGAGPASAGLSARHSHMTNTLNTPIEALEHAYPLRVVRYGVRRNSGGGGNHRGGDGLIREYELLCAASASLLSQNRSQGPAGAQSGSAGAAGRNRLLRRGAQQELAGSASLELKPGDRLCVETPGGGGWGRPLKR